MAKKKTLSDILQTPIDFIYLWASEAFIAQLGSKSSIIKQKKYNQYQTLWRIMVDNTKSSNGDDQMAAYNSWVEKIGKAIEDVYAMKPAKILEKLAMGEQVFGKDWNRGVYGVGGKTKISFDQDMGGVYVNPQDGMIMMPDGTPLSTNKPVYGENGVIVGYSATVGTAQYQSALAVEGGYCSYSYSDSTGRIETADGVSLAASSSSFWQNANNYIPIIEDVLSWLKSLIESYLPGGSRTVLTSQNTLPSQSEWIETDSGNGGLIAGGVALATLALITMDKPKGKSK